MALRSLVNRTTLKRFGGFANHTEFKHVWEEVDERRRLKLGPVTGIKHWDVRVVHRWNSVQNERSLVK